MFDKPTFSYANIFAIIEIFRLKYVKIYINFNKLFNRNGE